MAIHNQLNFSANLLALVTLTAKTVYDLYFNPRRFKVELTTLGEIPALTAKRKRTDTSTALTFLFLALSYLLFILRELL